MPRRHDQRHGSGTAAAREGDLLRDELLHGLQVLHPSLLQPARLQRRLVHHHLPPPADAFTRPPLAANILLSFRIPGIPRAGPGRLPAGPPRGRSAHLGVGGEL